MIIENGQLIELHLSSAIDGKVCIKQGASLGSPYIIVDVNSFPKIASVLINAHESIKTVDRGTCGECRHWSTEPSNESNIGMCEYPPESFEQAFQELRSKLPIALDLNKFFNEESDFHYSHKTEGKDCNCFERI